MAKSTARQFAASVLEQLGDLKLKLCIPQIAERIWQDVLEEHERREILGGIKRRSAPAKLKRSSDCSGPRSTMVQTITPAEVLKGYARIRRTSPARTLADLAQSVNLLSDLDHRRLRRLIGEPLRPTPSLPVWDRSSGLLRYEGNIVRKVNANGGNIRRILDCFEEQGWQSRVDNPLPGGSDSKRLRNALASLHAGLSVLRFQADGSASGIRWNAE